MRTVPMVEALSAMAVATAPITPCMAESMELSISPMLGGVDIFIHQVTLNSIDLYIIVEEK